MSAAGLRRWADHHVAVTDAVQRMVSTTEVADVVWDTPAGTVHSARRCFPWPPPSAAGRSRSLDRTRRCRSFRRLLASLRSSQRLRSTDPPAGGVQSLPGNPVSPRYAQDLHGRGPDTFLSLSHRSGSRTPGFMIPRGSSACFAAPIAAKNVEPRSCSYGGRCNRPIA